MGPTNIHRASAFLDRAGSNFEDQATVQPFGIQVYAISQDFSQGKLDKYSKILNDFQEDVWLMDNAGENKAPISPVTIFGHTVTSPPEHLIVPKTCISPGLATKPIINYAMGKKIEPAEPKEALHFILIIQGQNGGAKWKIVSEDNLQDVASTVMSEVLNRYSVVFSGALFESDFKRLKARNGPHTFSRAKSVAELSDIAKTKKENTIGILC